VKCFEQSFVIVRSQIWSSALATMIISSKNKINDGYNDNPLYVSFINLQKQRHTVAALN